MRDGPVVARVEGRGLLRHLEFVVVDGGRRKRVRETHVCCRVCEELCDGADCDAQDTCYRCQVEAELQDAPVHDDNEWARRKLRSCVGGSVCFPPPLSH